MLKRIGNGVQKFLQFDLLRFQKLSLTNRLKYGLALFTASSLILGLGGATYLSFIVLQRQVVSLQEERSQAVSNEILAYVDDLRSNIEYLARIPGLTDMAFKDQNNLLHGLLRRNKAYRRAAIFDKTGNLLDIVSQDNILLQENFSRNLMFRQVFEVKADFISPVEPGPFTRSPTITWAVPIRDQQDEVAGALLVQISLDFLNAIVSQISVGETGYVYVIDNRNISITSQDEDGLFTLEDLSNEPFIAEFPLESKIFTAIYNGLNGERVLGAVSPIQGVPWRVVVEISLAEIYEPILSMVLLMGSGVLVAVGLAIGLGIRVASQVVTPLEQLTNASARMSAGETDVQVAISTDDEMGVLATTFNRMTVQIRHLVHGLEQRAQRIRQVNALNERLVAILDLDELLLETVNQLITYFDYRRARIYLLDEQEVNLILVAGTGKVSEEMKARHYHIPLNAPSSLVAQAARQREMVQKDHFQESADVEANFLAFDAYREFTLPIILEQDVLGVLEIHSSQVSGELYELEQDELGLLRLVINQIAVAIRNARLFAEVNTSLAEARALERQYLHHAWDRQRILQKRTGRALFSVEEFSLNQDVVAEIEQQASVYDQPTIVQFSEESSNDRSRFIIGNPTLANANQGTQKSAALVAPITLRGIKIGHLQVHDDADRFWTESDLAFVNAVIDQVAQAAENLRLLDEAQEKASREQRISQITDKMRRAPNIEALMQLTVSEISKALDPDRAFVHLETRVQNENDLVE